jgi:ubiquinone/menaquinone biosynthesis C-methylase UbiE
LRLQRPSEINGGGLPAEAMRVTTMSFREAEHAGWTARARSYDACFAAITNQAIPHVLAAFGNLADRALLDVCCGPGHLAAAAMAAGAHAEGIDFAPTMVALAQGNYPAIPFREGDAEHLPLPDGSFDAVACVFGVMHMTHPDLAVAEAFRVLRHGGVFAFTQWAAEDELLNIVADAISKHGNPGVNMPLAPPLMRFSNPDECRRTLLAHGFSEVSTTRIELEWHGDQPEAVLDLIRGGAVRAAMLIEAQAPRDRERVHAAILDAVKLRHTPNGGYLVRRPAVLTRGRRPAV